MTNEIKHIATAVVVVMQATCLVATQDVYTGDEAILDCPVTNSIPKWSKMSGTTTAVVYSNQDDSTINPSLPHKDRLSINNMGSLVISDTERSDAGNYTCAYTGFGQKRMKLIVKVKPTTLVISNKETIASKGDIIRGKEDDNVSLICTSKGGYPEQSVKWNTNSHDLQTAKNVSTDSDGLYTVKVTHIVNAKRDNDRKIYTCKTGYDGQEDLLSASVMLYLTLRPTQPKITGSSVIAENDTAIFNCRTDGSRPEASILWRYNGSNLPKPVITDFDPSSETYTVESNYSSGTLRRNDNHKSLVCVVSHDALSTSLKQTHTLNITFLPVSVTLSGNIHIVVNGTSSIELTCTASTANPEPTLNWRLGNDPITSGIIRGPVLSGDFGGKVVIEKLTLTPTRYMDGKIIFCDFNADVRDQKTLNLTYNPITTIEGPSSITVTEGERLSFNCSAKSKPVSTFTWYHEGVPVQNSNGQQANNTFALILPKVERESFGNYTCEADNNVKPSTTDTVTLNVLFSPLSVALTGNAQIIANGVNPLKLTCRANTANPPATLHWRQEQTPISSGITRSTASGDFGGIMVSETVTLRPTRHMDGDIISCAFNDDVKDVTTLNLTYSPIVLVPRQVTAIEGEPNVTLKCLADSKPPSTFKWFKSEQANPVHEGRGTADYNVLKYVIPLVDRNDSGQYICKAENEQGTPDLSNSTLELIVYYPPSVTVTTTNTTVNASNVEIICNANGLPKNCNFSKWHHSWEGVTPPIRTKFPYLITGTRTQQILNITTPSYEDTGIYTCGASNGVVRWETQTYETVNSVYLLVKSYPIVTSEEHNKGTIKITPPLNIQFAFSVQFYSNTDNTEASLYRKINATVESNMTYERVNNVSLHIIAAEVNLPVHGQLIRTPGYHLTLNHTFYSSSEYGLYFLEITNDIGAREVFFNATPESAPYTPVFLKIDSAVTAITVSWVRGFHGGFPQTFVIQYRESSYPWVNGTSKEGNLSTSSERISSTISSLKPSTTYYIRMFAFNMMGRSKFTETINTTTKMKAEVPTASSYVGFIAGGAAGGIVLAAIFVALVILFLRRRKDYLKSRSKSLLKDNESSPDTKSTDDTPEINLNPMYEPAGPLPSTSTNSDVYSQVDKNRKTAQQIYSQVDKPKRGLKFSGSEVKENVYAQVKKNTHREKDAGKPKQKKQKPVKKTKKEKQTEGDLYDNVDTPNSAVTEMDTVYENPSCSIKDEQVRNQDGLIYADLDLPKEIVGKDTKAVIHGLDDRTDYADIKYGEVGEQAPDSDEEKK